MRTRKNPPQDLGDFLPRPGTGTHHDREAPLEPPHTFAYHVHGPVAGAHHQRAATTDPGIQQQRDDGLGLAGPGRSVDDGQPLAPEHPFHGLTVARR
jgi:hypothetical protein